jgi:hypothetical protein
MDFSDKEMKVLLQALYRYRGEVSGASQSEQNRYGIVLSIIDKIEGEVGPATAERTRFDEEMAKSLSVLATGRTGSSERSRKAGREARREAKGELDKGKALPKVKKASASRSASTKSRGAGAPAKATRAKSTKSTGPKKAGAGKTK